MRSEAFTCGEGFTALDVVYVIKNARGHSASHRNAAFSKCSSHSNVTHYEKKHPALRWVLFLMAAEEGFEPSQTESESVVLPLHNSAMSFVNG